MDKDFKDIANSLTNVEPPKYLKQAVFVRIEAEKMRMIALKRLFFRIGFVISGISSIAAVAIFGKEILSSEFFSLASLSFSDVNTVMAMWQDYLMSLLETLPTVTIAATLLPIFVLLLLIREYGKLEAYNNYSLKN
jgi:hypothetical protein